MGPEKRGEGVEGWGEGIEVEGRVWEEGNIEREEGGGFRLKVADRLIETADPKELMFPDGKPLVFFAAGKCEKSLR